MCLARNPDCDAKGCHGLGLLLFICNQDTTIFANKIHGNDCDDSDFNWSKRIKSEVYYPLPLTLFLKSFNAH